MSAKTLAGCSFEPTGDQTGATDHQAPEATAAEIQFREDLWRAYRLEAINAGFSAAQATEYATALSLAMGRRNCIRNGACRAGLVLSEPTRGGQANNQPGVTPTPVGERERQPRGEPKLPAPLDQPASFAGGRGAKAEGREGTTKWNQNLLHTKTPGRKPSGKKLEEPSSTIVKRVFIVEDHPVLRETLVQIVSRENDLTVCGQARAARQAFKAIGRVKPDLVLVDITLPGKSGLELVKELRAVDRKIKLLVVSMHDAALYADRALQAGGNGYLRKQGDPEALIHAIRDVLDGRSYVSEDVG